MTFEMQAYTQGQTTCNIQLQINNYKTSKSGTLTVESSLGCPSGYNVPHATSTVTITNPPGNGGGGNPPPPPPQTGLSCAWVYQGELQCATRIFDLATTSPSQVTLQETSTNIGEACEAQIVVVNYQTANSGVEHAASGLSCVRNTLVPVKLTNTWNSAPKPKDPTQQNNAPNISLVCTVSIFNPVTWLICPLVSAAQGAIEGLTSGIDSLLTVNTNEIFGNTNTKGSTGAGFYQAWNTFRIFGAGLIVIAGLIMLIAEATGTSAVDSYTIHKVMPRILLAIVFITLSWPLLNFAITLSNDVGIGIRAIIYTPFEGIGTTVRVNGGAATVGAIAGTATFLTLGLLGIASFMLTALLAVFVGFLVLFIRQVAIQMLVIFAPLAIACYVLPGTQKAWNFWKDTFIAMLIVFPIISAMIAMGRVFAVVMYNNRTGGVPTFVNEIGAFIVYFAPYFMLPLAFRWAGGAMATLGSFVNDRHRGAFDRLKNARKNQAANNMHAMKTGNRFKSSNWAASRFNRATRGAANLGAAGFNPAKMRSRYQAGMSGAKEEELKEYMEKNAAFNSMRGSDNLLQATMANMGGGKSEADWRRYLSSLTDDKGQHQYEGADLEQAVATIRDAKRGTSDDVFHQASVMANASTGTGWKDGGATEMMESINEAFGDDRHGANNALAQMRESASRSGRLDLGGARFGDQAAGLSQMYNEAKANGGKVSAGTKQSVKSSINKSILETKGASEFARSRGQAVKQIAPEMVKNLEAAHAKLDSTAVGSKERALAHRELAQQYANMANFHDTLNYMAPENAKIISDQVLAHEINGQSVMQHIETYQRTGNTDFVETRKDYDAMRNK